MGIYCLPPIAFDKFAHWGYSFDMDTIKRYATWLFMLSLLLLLFSCAPRPLLDSSYLKDGDRNVSFRDLREHPDQNKGRLFIMGGVIVNLKLSEAGYQLEAMYVPVDRYGYFEDKVRSEGRFLAVLSKEGEMLDPAEFTQGKRVSIAGEFIETRIGKIDQMDYVYPVFRIKQINLWTRDQRYYYYPYYPYYYGPWFYPYPYPYPYIYRYHHRFPR
jgi:outer membrane lipoprotein